MDKGRALIRRSLALRHVDCGSCNACESELSMLFSPGYDAQRSGIDIAASPRHADGLVVSGPGTMQMNAALARTAEAVGQPCFIVALGDCAISGHVHAGGYASGNGTSSQLSVDLEIPGCPPAPADILAALTRFMRGGK